MAEITYDDIKKASECIKTTNIKGKEYAEVNQRIKVFRMLYPAGCIKTFLVNDDGSRCMFKAEAYDADGKLLGTGHAFEVMSASYINKTSYIENCETSAVGRCLAMCGIGIDTSVASYEEVDNAIRQQERNEPVEAQEEFKDAPANKIMKDKVLSELDRCGMTLDQLKGAIANKYPDFDLEKMLVSEFVYIKQKFDKTPSKK